MGKKKKQQAAARTAAAGPAKKRQQKRVRNHDRRATPGLPPGVVARIPAPVITTRHRTYLEFVENKDKKKKLEFEVTTAREPPPGFEFVPVGNPDLTNACKELSREQDAMIFIVSDSREVDANRLGIHMNRVGHHIRRTIVEEARALIGQPQEYFLETVNGRPEPIPESQEEINAQADGVIRDLFPRMPNTDRQIIIDRSFRKGHANRTVGLAAELTLSRRVQLAVLAHIRHTHTRYDQLIREVGWSNARKAVESLCLDFLVKWRGDEETGRDQLDEILREIIVISDSEESETDDDQDSDDSDDDGSDESQPGSGSRGSITSDAPSPADQQTRAGPDQILEPERVALDTGLAPVHFHPRRALHRRLNSRNVQRYEAAAQSRWQQAQERVRHDPARDLASSVPAPIPQGGANGQLDQAYAQEGSRQTYNLYGRPSVPRDQYNQSDYRTSQEPMRRGSQPPGAGPELVPLYQRNHQQLAPQAGVPGINGHRNLVDYGTARPMAERPELKDYLVPSIEPMSPQADNSSSPIFVRSLPPRPQQQLQTLRQPLSPGRYLRRRSGSPVQRLPHHAPVSYIVREREPLQSRPRLADEHRFEDLRLSSHGPSAPPYGRGSERREEPQRYQSPIGQPSRNAHVIGPREGQYVEYSRAPPDHGPRPVMATESKAAMPDYHDNRYLPRTERHPIVVEDWGRGAEKVMLVPSRQMHLENPPYLKREGDPRMQGVGRVPVVALEDNPRAPPPHGRPALVGEAHYEPRSSREYVPAPGSAFLQRQPEGPAREPSPLYYERVRPAQQRQYPPPDHGYTDRFGNGFTAINVERDGHRPLPGGPHPEQPHAGNGYPVHPGHPGHPGHLPRNYSPGQFGSPRLQQPPAPGPPRREYIEID